MYIFIDHLLGEQRKAFPSRHRINHSFFRRRERRRCREILTQRHLRDRHNNWKRLEANKRRTRDSWPRGAGGEDGDGGANGNRNGDRGSLGTRGQKNAG